MRKSISVEQQAEEVRKLRKETGAGVRDCLKALKIGRASCRERV